MNAVCVLVGCLLVCRRSCLRRLRDDGACWLLHVSRCGRLWQQLLGMGCNGDEQWQGVLARVVTPTDWMIGTGWGRRPSTSHHSTDASCIDG